MANIKITELTETTQVQDTDYFVVDNGTETKKVKKQNLGVTVDAYTKAETDALLSLYSLITETGKTIELSMNSSTFILTSTLKDKNGNVLSTSNIDLPLEEMIVSMSYDNTTKELVITLKSGSVTRVPIGDIISGLATQSYVTNAITAEDTSIKAWANGRFLTEHQSLANYYNKTETNELLEDYAKQDGYYGNSGGVFQYSTNFLGKNTPQQARDIVYRPTASQFSGQSWNADSIGGDTATIDKIKGKTLVFNQLVNHGNFDASTGWGVNSSVSGSYWENGIYHVIQKSTTTRSGLGRGEIIPIVGHKYYALANVKNTTNDRFIFGVGFSYEFTEKYIEPNVKSSVDGIITCRNTGGNYNGFYVGSRRADDVERTFDVYFAMLIDLTQMFGAGNEPTTVEEFKSMFPLDYYEYNEGELISFNGTGLKTNGFNQWDEEWELGRLNPDNGSEVSSTSHIRCKNFINVLPNMQYYISVPSRIHVGNFNACFYDNEKNFISFSSGSLNPKTTPSNCAYMRFYMDTAYGTTYTNDININLSWSGLRNGEYEPYWENTLQLPINTYFPDGMKSAGVVYDELSKDKAIKRIGKIKVKDITWQVLSSVGELNRFEGTYTSNPPALAPNNEIFAISNKLIATGYTSLIDGSISVRSNLQQFKILTSLYSTVVDMVNAFGEYDIYYFLATPVETPISPELNLNYKVDDFGTEMLLPQNTDDILTSPMNADIIYQIDYEAQIRNNDSLNISKKSMDNFISAFNASNIGTITQTWRTADKEYDYSINEGLQSLTNAEIDTLWEGAQ